MYYEDQKRYKITDWDGNIHYTQPETINSWTEEKRSIVEEDTKVESNSETQDVIKWVKCGGRKYVVCGPWKYKKPVHDYYLTTTTSTYYKRKQIIDPDGIVTFGDWAEYDKKVDSKKT